MPQASVVKGNIIAMHSVKLITITIWGGTCLGIQP